MGSIFGLNSLPAVFCSWCLTITSFPDKVNYTQRIMLYGSVFLLLLVPISLLILVIVRLSYKAAAHVCGASSRWQPSSVTL